MVFSEYVMFKSKKQLLTAGLVFPENGPRNEQMAYFIWRKILV